MFWSRTVVGPGSNSTSTSTIRKVKRNMRPYKGRTDLDDWASGSEYERTKKTSRRNSRSHTDCWNRNVRLYLQFEARPNSQSRQSRAANPARHITDSSGLHYDEKHGLRPSFALHIRPANQRDSQLLQSRSPDTSRRKH